MAETLTISKLTFFAGPEWAVTLLGQSYNPASTGNLFKTTKYTLSSTPGPTAAYGVDTMYAKVSTIAASGTLTIDLTSFVDIAAQSATSMARLKGFWFFLLSSLEDSSINYTPTGITVGAGASNGHLLTLADASDLNTLRAGEGWSWFTPSTTGKTVDSTHKNITTTNLDSSNACKVAIVLVGSKT